MLQPVRTKYRKAFKGRIHGKASRAVKLNLWKGNINFSRTSSLILMSIIFLDLSLRDLIDYIFLQKKFKLCCLVGFNNKFIKDQVMLPLCTLIRSGPSNGATRASTIIRSGPTNGASRESSSPNKCAAMVALVGPVTIAIYDVPRKIWHTFIYLNSFITSSPG